MKIYRRRLNGFNSYQILTVSDDNKFESIWNDSLGSYQVKGLCPAEFKEGESVPRGFLKKYGFKRFYPEDFWQYWYTSKLENIAKYFGKTTGDFTGSF